MAQSVADVELLDRVITGAKPVRAARLKGVRLGLVKELLDVDLSKQQQSSDWGAAKLSDAQLAYAASDVLHLHKLRNTLESMLVREGRLDLAQKCFSFIGTRAALDLNGWSEVDIFAH